MAETYLFINIQWYKVLLTVRYVVVWISHSQLENRIFISLLTCQVQFSHTLNTFISSSYFSMLFGMAVINFKLNSVVLSSVGLCLREKANSAAKFEPCCALSASKIKIAWGPRWDLNHCHNAVEEIGFRFFFNFFFFPRPAFFPQTAAKICVSSPVITLCTTTVLKNDDQNLGSSGSVIRMSACLMSYPHRMVANCMNGENCCNVISFIRDPELWVLLKLCYIWCTQIHISVSVLSEIAYVFPHKGSF